MVDIPFNVEYTASSGHKANHDMLRPNCRYVPLETPRFGRSMAVETIMKVNKTIGDEGITVDFWIIKVHTSN